MKPRIWQAYFLLRLSLPHSVQYVWTHFKYCFFLVDTKCKIFRFYSNPIVPWNILFANIFRGFLSFPSRDNLKLANMFFKSWGSVQQTWKKLLKPQNLQRKLKDKTKFCKKNKRGAWKMSLLYNWAQSVANTFRLRNHMAWIWRSAEAEIRHVFGDTPITEASIGAAPPDILVKLSGYRSLLISIWNYTLNWAACG